MSNRQPNNPKVMTSDTLSGQGEVSLNADTQAEPESDVIPYRPEGVLPEVATFGTEERYAPVHTASQISDFSDPTPQEAPHVPLHPMAAQFDPDKVLVDLEGTLNFVATAPRRPIIIPQSEDVRIAKEEEDARNRKVAEESATMLFQRIVQTTREDFQRRVATGDTVWCTPFDRYGKFGGTHYVGSINGAKFTVPWNRGSEVPSNIYQHMLNAGVVQAENAKDDYLYAKKSSRIESVKWNDNPYRVMNVHDMTRIAQGMG